MEVPLACTGAVRVEAFWHTPGDPAHVLEQWRGASLAFTSTGVWQVRSGAGSGQVDQGWLLAGRAGDEFECHHPAGVEDRALSVVFLGDVEPPSESLIPVGRRGRQLWRQLRRAMASRCQDAQEIDAVAASLLAWARHPVEHATVIGERTRVQVAAVRREADRRFGDAGLDIVAAAGDVGLSRTRLIHAFRDVVGVTPHRYLLERRLSHAAGLLGCTGMQVVEVCFASGFGSLARFNAAFKQAHGVTPLAYRAAISGRQ